MSPGLFHFHSSDHAWCHGWAPGAHALPAGPCSPATTPEGLVSKIKIFIFTQCFPYLFHVHIYLVILILLYLAVKESGSKKQGKSDQNLENETPTSFRPKHWKELLGIQKPTAGDWAAWATQEQGRAKKTAEGLLLQNRRGNH